jgi:hypothetical protein
MTPVRQQPRPVAQAFEISNWKPFVKNTLQGFFTVTTPGGMVIHGCTYHIKGESRWVGMPAKEFTTTAGVKSWTPQIEFTGKEPREKFQAGVLEAIDQMNEGWE